MHTLTANIAHNPLRGDVNMAAGCSSGDAPSVFKWSDEDIERLINWRIANDALFTGKRNAAIKGFEAFVHQSNLLGKVSAAWVKKKWENLKQNYKDLKCLQSGVSTEGGELTAASWKWYGVMDAALGSKPSITPPVLIQSGDQDVGSSPSVPGPSNIGGTKRKRGSGESELLSYLRELEEKEAKREEEAQLREERREREFEERDRRKEEERERRKEEEREEEARRREEEFRVGMEMRDEEMRRECRNVDVGCGNCFCQTVPHEITAHNFSVGVSVVLVVDIIITIAHICFHDVTGGRAVVKTTFVESKTRTSRVQVKTKSKKV
ncbi:hypothetical protein PO909_029378 [Leuciscus waleckii]